MAAAEREASREEERRERERVEQEERFRSRLEAQERIRAEAEGRRRHPDEGHRVEVTEEKVGKEKVSSICTKKHPPFFFRFIGV